MIIEELKFKCNKCGKQMIFKNINIVDSDYNQYVINILDQNENNYEGMCDCEWKELLKGME